MADDPTTSAEQATSTATATEGETSAKSDAQTSTQTTSGASRSADAEHMVPSYRLREQTERTRQAEQQLTELRGRMDEQDRRMRAAFGVDQSDPRRDAIRKEFLGYFPEYAKLEKLAEHAEEVEKLLALRTDLENGLERSRVGIGHAAYDHIDTLMADAYGDKVPPFAKQAAYAAFTGWIASDPELNAYYQQCEQSGRFDPRIASEFWKLYSSGVLESHRTHFSAAEQHRRALAARVPRGGGGGDVIPGKKERKPFKTLDEAVEAADEELKAQRAARPAL